MRCFIISLFICLLIVEFILEFKLYLMTINY